MSRHRLTKVGVYLRQHWRRVGVYSAGTIIGLLLVVQLTLPWGSLPLYATIGGVDVGGKSAAEAVELLDDKYRKLPVELYFGNGREPYRKPHPADIGLTIGSRPQVDAAVYPAWLRLIPTSLWWAHMVTQKKEPSYARDVEKAKTYVKKELGESCKVVPQNASLTYKDKKLTVVPAVDGGTCNLSDVERMLSAVKPKIDSHALRVPMKQHPAAIHDDRAEKFADKLKKRTENVTIKTGGQTVALPQDTLLSWLDFEAPDSGIIAKVNADKSAEYFSNQLAPKVTVSPGTSRITTLDFTEISRVDGRSGQALDTLATIDLLNYWLAGGGAELVAKTKVVPPTPVFTRNYTPTDTGMTALITQFAESHPGTFGVSFAELDGAKRHAGYQDTKIFRTASTYKLFVAYGVLKRVENGQFRWSDQIQGGRDLAKCFDDMIVKSDNPCAESLLEKIGYRTLTNELRAIGLGSSSFLVDYPKTTARDLMTFVGSLQKGQLLSPDSTNRLLATMKRNIFRQGIPAGARGTVGDKVGFLEGFLHDAAIVYSPTGTYALSIMTEGSSWGAIAELTRKIEALRTQG